MWKNWNPFRRKQKEDVGIGDKPEVGNAAGKENTIEKTMMVTSSSESGHSSDGSRSTYHASKMDPNSSRNEFSVNSNNGVIPRDTETFQGQSEKRTNGFNSQESEDVYCLSPHNNSFSVSSHRQSLRNRTRMGVHDQLNMSLPITSLQDLSGQHRPVTSSPSTGRKVHGLSRGDSMKVKLENKSFSGVHGPLLSTPIVPKVRRALESSSGIRSPQSTLLSGSRKPVGRSASLNYGSRNPTKPTAGQVPWVRLKRRESIGLSDIASGNTPQSPNTIKLAAPEPRLLRAAPSFKSTPLIVTTEPSRARVVDTQTVVSALREKRKRFGVHPHDESHSDDTWQNAAKRRRQDSSQSNASSVSIPPMPESLPNLMGSPGASLLHIENLADQRPSTVPAVDTFINHHHQDIGLGGEQNPLHQYQQPYLHHQQHLQQQQNLGNKNNSKSVLRSIQSSLSSSLRARANLSLLHQGGIDLKRLRSMTQNQGMARRMSFSSDVSMPEESSNSPDEPQAKVFRQLSLPAETSTATPTSSSLPEPTTAGQMNTKTRVSENAGSGVVGTPTKRKIAEGVVLRKHNLAMNAGNSPAKPMKALAASTLMSTSDFESDRQKEYQRRVLDLLDGEEAVQPKTTTLSLSTATVSTSVVTSTTTNLLVTPTSSALGLVASSAATSAAVSASLDSLNKLVQSSSTTPALTSTSNSASTSVGSAETLSQLLMSNQDTPQPILLGSTTTATSASGFSVPGKSLVQPNSAVPTPSPDKTISTTTAPNLITDTSIASVTQPASSGFSLSMPTSAPGGFQVNFGAPVSNTQTTSADSTAAKVSSGLVPQSAAGGFSLSSSLSSASNTGITTLQGTSQTLQASGFSFPAGQLVSSSITATQPKGSIQFGNSSTLTGPLPSLAQPNTALTSPSTGALGVKAVQAPTSQPGPFSFTTASTQPAVTVASSSLGSGISFSGLAANTSGQNFNFSSPQPSVASITAPSFNFQATTSKNNSLTSSFSFGQPSTSTSSAPGFNFGTARVTQPASSTVATTSMSFGTLTTQPFGFGISPAASGLATSGTLAGTNPGSFMAPVGSSAAPTFTLGTGGLSSQAGQTGSFGGFGTNTQTATSNSALPGSGLQPRSLFETAPATSSSSAIGTSAVPSSGLTFGTVNPQTQQNQQPFGASSAPPPPYSPFSATAPSTTASAASFAFGQASSTSASSPFTFGAASSQPGNVNPFGGSTTSSVIGAQTAATTLAGSIFGGATGQTFGTTTATPFGATPKSTAPSAFGSTVTSPAFGTASANPVPPAFGSAGQSSNQPFTLGASTPGAKPPTQPAAFGSHPTQSFGGPPSTQASSIFGAKSPAFGSAPTTAPPAFGLSFTSPPAFGTPSTPQQKPAFGSAASTPQQRPAFGSAATTFGTASPSTFGAGAARPVFGSTTQIAAQGFGAQPNQMASPSPFGGASATSSSMFGAPKANPFGAATTTQSSFNFSAQQPQQTSAFGTQPQNSASTGFNFGAQVASPSTGGFNFSAQAPQKPPFQAAAPGGFNFAAAAGGGTGNFNFGATTPGAPNMFTPQTPNSAPRPRVYRSRQGRRGGTKR